MQQAPKAVKRKKASTSKRALDPEEVRAHVDAMLEVLSGGDPNAEFISAVQLSEASIKLGVTIDIDLAHSMIEYCTGNVDDVEISKEQFVQTLQRLVDTKSIPSHQTLQHEA